MSVKDALYEGNIYAVDIQGFVIKDAFIPKELTFQKCGEDDFFTYLFKPIIPFLYLTNAEKKQVRWLEKYHHCIQYSTGDMCIDRIRNILAPLNFKRIYVKGREKKKFLEKYLSNCTICELESDINCPKFIRQVNNCRNHKYEYNICSENNVKCLIKYLLCKN